MSSYLTKEFIEEQEKKLRTEHKKAEEEIARLRSDDPFSDPEHVVDNAAIDTDVREQSQHQVIEAEINVLQRRLDDITHALQKIEKGNYGYCERTNKPIPEARLKLIPEARTCVEDEHVH
jgi:RNA polymerase-binding transcription factor DksA